jgi:Zn-dependent M28 family amino/carboxypeptidase
VDVGRGTLQEFEAVEKRIKGRIVLVRHEYPFASGTIHRRLKYNWSRERGAAGFVIANNLPGNMLVTGSVGQDLSDNIPAVGVSLETGSVLENGRRDRFQGVRLSLRSERRAATGVNLIAEVPGRGPEWVVVCAHYDGHDLAQSALDNATGVVTVLQILRSIGPHVSRLPRGLRAILFTAEEWSLLGSRRYVDQLSDGMCRGISVVVNLDTIAGSSRLACLTSGFEELNAFVERVGIDIGYHFRPVLPVMRNSDHFNFVQRGVPAMRVVAGFDEPDAGGRFLLTSGDTCDKVPSGELKTAALAAAELVWCALTWSGSIARHKTPDEVKGLLGSIS